ncbi:MAG: hypothetical protein ACOCSE_01500 [Chitinivibrionales bacterium]
MMLDDDFDADDILRDVDEQNFGYENDDGEMRELNFDDIEDENANFSELASDIDSTDDLWE